MELLKDEEHLNFKALEKEFNDNGIGDFSNFDFTTFNSTLDDFKDFGNVGIIDGNFRSLEISKDFEIGEIGEMYIKEITENTEHYKKNISDFSDSF